jgi:hypothetical protein
VPEAWRLPAAEGGVASSSIRDAMLDTRAASMGSIAGLRAICFPSSDVAFANAVHRSLASESIRYPWQLEDALRSHYPSIQVRVREITGEPEVTWYVYRDADFASWPAS